MKQLKLFELPASTAFGGDLLKGKRKSKRPLSTKHGIHTTLRADVRPCGTFRAADRLIRNLINKWAVRFDVKVYMVSVNSNHIHLLFKLARREDFARFVKALCSEIVGHLGVKWLVRPWTRLVAWGRAFQIVKNYIGRNQKEAHGQIRYQRQKARAGP